MGKQHDVWGITRQRSGVIVQMFTVEICFNFGGVIDKVKIDVGTYVVVLTMIIKDYKPEESYLELMK